MEKNEIFSTLKNKYNNLYSQMVFKDSIFDTYKEELESCKDQKEFFEYFNLSDVQEWIKELKEYLEEEVDEGDCFEANATSYPYNQL